MHFTGEEAVRVYGRNDQEHEMRTNHSFALLLLMTALLAVVVIRTMGRQGAEPAKSAPRNLVSVEGCLSQNQVLAGLRVLSFGDYENQQKAVALLRADANRSTTCRKQVITNLMSAMDQPNLDLTGGTPQFFLWHYGTRLLGELKAVEALDLLIAKFDLHDGSGFPLNHYPALGGVIKMGETALPKLELVLKQNSDPHTRQYAVFCIALIGGQSAHDILKQAVKTEPDPCVASCIRATLSEFSNKRRPHQISDVGRTTWYTTFLCG